jgi:hypothetical protein
MRHPDSKQITGISAKLVRWCSATMLLLLLFTASDTAFGSLPPQQEKPASCINQEKDVDAVTSWRGLYAYYARYRHCGFDADAAEGISDVIAKLLVDHWDGLTAVSHELNADQGFGRFIVGGANGTVGQETLNKIIRKTHERKCPIKNSNFCETLAQRAREALAEFHQ